MSKTYEVSNPCTRCGKQRVENGITKEAFGDGFVTVTQTVCPDPECQKMVDNQLEKERKKREELNVDGKSNQRGNPTWMRRKSAGA